MDLPPPQLTSEQRQALAASGGAVQIEDAETNKVYLIVEQGFASTLDESYIRQGLDHAADQVRRGEESTWSPEEIKAVGRELMAKRRTQS